MKKHEKIIKILKKEYPEAKTALKHKNAYQLLVATMLSAQATDVQINKITPALFKKYPNVKKLANTKLDELEKLIYSSGYYKTKAKRLKSMAQTVVKEFNGKIPNNMINLTKLPGVGRKTANVVLQSFFNKTQGIVVDTHVTRLSNLLGFTKNKNPEKIEKDLINVFDKKDWSFISIALILHGRKICIARRPKCKECKLNNLCPSSRV
ncbi:endonuclease III [Candidatus Micrarchaeota archaeon]|jgi:endonuclease-3|nr:endonuclease III [Candidatus Micrarchaeota archaeon]